MTATGILGGSFNPPHIGHLLCARFAAEQLGLDEVLLVPLSEPSHREPLPGPGPQERLELCRLAAAGEPLISVSDVEVRRGGLSYTVDTLEELHGAGRDELTLILGSDAAARLGEWKEPGRVAALAALAVAPRTAGDEPGAVVRSLQAEYPDTRVSSFRMPLIEVSSTMVRERAASGLSIRDLVPRPVEERILEAGMYAEMSSR